MNNIKEEYFNMAIFISCDNCYVFRNKCYNCKNYKFNEVPFRIRLNGTKGLLYRDVEFHIILKNNGIMV